MERKGKSQQIEECSLPVRCLETGLDISVRKICSSSERNQNAQGMGKRSRNRLSVSQVRTGQTNSTHKTTWKSDVQLGEAMRGKLHLSPGSPSHLCPLLLPNRAVVGQTPSSFWYLRAPPGNVTMRRDCKPC